MDIKKSSQSIVAKNISLMTKELKEFGKKKKLMIFL